MRTIATTFRNVSLRTAISTLLVMVTVLCSATLACGIYFSLAKGVEDQGRESALSQLRTAAAIFVSATSGYELVWAEEGGIDQIAVWGLLPYHDNDLVERISKVTGSSTSIYVVDRETGKLAVSTTTIADAGGAGAMNEVLEADSAIYQAISQGKSYVGQDVVAGLPAFIAYHPIMHDGNLAGVLFVADPADRVAGTLVGTMTVVLTVAALVTVVLGLIGYLLSLWITRPIPRLVAAMCVIAKGDFSIEVPFRDVRNEIGAMANAVDVFKENGLKVHSLTEGEKRASDERRLARAEMMESLQRSFGDVVDAAVDGDFSRRIDAVFPDDELNELASGVNNLVETVARGLAETGEVLSAMAGTDLTKRVAGLYRGAFLQLKTDTNLVADTLTEVIGRLRETSKGVRLATGEILTGANDLSERTTKQAATIEETSAVMEQLADIVVRNAENAEHASVNAESVSHIAEEGGAAMSDASGAMEQIIRSSAKISNIIVIIDDIAFQTNLLALNASVEAARAGEAGKGFAVVAVEVRRLAQRAAEASKEIKQLVEQSTVEVGHGSKLVSSAANKLAAIVEAVKTNGRLLDGIAKAGRQQASSIEEVNAAVRSMDEMTQHNAALVEETNAAISQTEVRARELDEIIEVFRLELHGPGELGMEDAAPSRLKEPAPRVSRPRLLARSA